MSLSKYQPTDINLLNLINNRWLLCKYFRRVSYFPLLVIHIGLNIKFNKQSINCTFCYLFPITGTRYIDLGLTVEKSVFLERLWHMQKTKNHVSFLRCVMLHRRSWKFFSFKKKLWYLQGFILVYLETPWDLRFNLQFLVLLDTL